MSLRTLRLLPLLLLLALGACAGAHNAPEPQGGATYRGLSCAPFARALTGVALRGDAADWWGEAAGRYPRTAAPRIGALLVLRRSARLPSGHVAVVSQVLGARQILVIQANWVRHRLNTDQLVVDVSPDNDWTLVRVWWPPAGRLGTHIYPAYGFILPDAALTRSALLAGADPAARAASGG
jgi:hypothetical protein